MSNTGGRAGRQADRTSAESFSSERRVVLVVDDSLTFRHTMRDHLLEAGHEPLIAESGEIALAMTARQMPHAAIVDLIMPGIDGVETCRRLHQLSSTLPMLMLTASDDATARKQGRAAGATEFLTKVPDFELVVETVLDFVRRMTRGRPGSSARLPQVREEPRENRLLDEVIAASGLARVLAEPAFARACHRAGVDPDRMTPPELCRALPQIERTLRMFVPAAEFTQRSSAISALAFPGGKKQGAP
jgi:CheY-like chemotaxis protein